MKIKIIFVAVFLVGLLAGGLGTGAYKNREFARTEKVYMKVIDGYKSSYETLAKEAKYTISNTYTIKKNKKGQVIYVPTSTMQIDEIIRNVDERIAELPVDSIQAETVKETFWDKVKTIFK